MDQSQATRVRLMGICTTAAAVGANLPYTAQPAPGPTVVLQVRIACALPVVLDSSHDNKQTSAAHGHHAR